MQHLREQILVMVDDAVQRCNGGIIVLSTDFTITIMPTENGLVAAGVMTIVVPGVIVGSNIVNHDCWMDWASPPSQEFVDNQVRGSFEAIRATYARNLSPNN